MNKNDRRKAQATLDDVVAGNFTDRTVDELFIRLRDYSHGNNIFRDLGHYVAHPDGRDQGIVVGALYMAECSLRRFFDYNQTGAKLDLRCFPSYMKDFFVFQVQRIAAYDKNFFAKYGVSDRKLTKTIKEAFTVDKGKGTASLNRQLQANVLDAVVALTSVLAFSALYTQALFFDEMRKVLNANKFVYDDSKLGLQEDKIMLALICMIHQKTHKFEKRIEGLCKLGFDNKRIDLAGNIALNQTLDFGNLVMYIHFSMPVKESADPLKIMFPLFSTNLKTADCCEDNLYVELEIAPDEKVKVPDFETNIHLTHDFKLARDQ